VVIAGCGRVAFDPVGATPGDSRMMDGTGDDAGQDAKAACLANTAYTTKAGLANRYREGVPQVTWGVARSMCQADGADLWVPQSVVELSAWSGDWVGLTDDIVEDVWVTVEGVPATFLPWEPTQPDGGPAENCARSTGALLEDRECTDARDFVCECVVGD
jgi:Lectin C-type domain